MNEKLPPPPTLTPPPLPLPLPPIDTEGASTYHITAAQVPLEFGGTLKSSKGSKNSSNQHSPQRKSLGGNGTGGLGSRGSSGIGLCACFGGCGYGSNRNRIAMPFWPAVLANLGICALLVGYIFIGSFIFLTIENSDDRVGSLDSNAAASWRAQQFAQMPQIIQQHQQQQQQQHQQQYQLQRQEDNGKNASIIAATATATATAIHSRIPRSTSPLRHLVKSTATGSVTPEVSTAHSQSMHDDDDDDDDVGVGVDVDVDKMQQDSIVAVGKRSAPPLDYELQTVAVPEEINDDYMGDEGSEDVSSEDVERRRTVENIWDITVSLNILYKENWTRLAALEIAKFQDQLVKRLVMDLTLSTANGATQSTTATAARGHSNSKQQKQQHTGGINGNDVASIGLGSYERQRFWQSENTQQHNQHRQHQRSQQPHNSWNNRRGNGGQRRKGEQFEWNFATAFLYSMTVITTVGYGTITPRTTLGRMVTIGYATLGIPLTLIYLSSIGSVLSKLLRYCSTRTRCGNCCCTKRTVSQRQGSNGGGGVGVGGGSSSIFSRHPQVADRKTELKLKHFQQPQQQQPLPYCYVRPPAVTTTEMEMQQQQQQHQHQQQQQQQHSGNTGGVVYDNLSVTTSAAGEATRHTSTTVAALSWHLVPSVGLCLLVLLAYVSFGAVVIALLEDWPLIDGIYFCFMSLSTIGFCDLLPGMGGGSRRVTQAGNITTTTTTATTTTNIVIWFCAFYILSGLTLTSMCVNLLHDEIASRMRVVVKFEKVHDMQKEQRDSGGYFSARS